MRFLLPPTTVVAWLLTALAANAGNSRPVLDSPVPVTTGGSLSVAGAISADAQFVLFLSRANNLVTNDSANASLDVFLRERLRGTTTLISVDVSGVGGATGNCSSPSVSSNGLWVAFESTARNLAPGITNDASNVFLRDVAGQTTTKVSTAPDEQPANGPSFNPQLSADGRFVIFESAAGNLVAGATNSPREIFRFDRLTGLNERVSGGRIFPDHILPANGPAHSPSPTPDAQSTAYVRTTTNSAGQIVGGEIFAWSAQSSTSVWISAGVLTNNLTGIPALCSDPVLSADGRFVAFKEITGSNGVSLYRQTNPPEANRAPERITTSAVSQGIPAISADGRFVAYAGPDGVHLWDAHDSQDHLVLANLPAPNRRLCANPALAADASRLAFLVTSNGLGSIYVHARLSGLTTPAFTLPDGAPGPANDAQPPLITADGRTLVFDSTSDQLVPDDANRASDVFAALPDHGTVECVSVRDSSRPSVTPPASSRRWPGSLNANGRVVAVSSQDRGGADTNQLPDLYVRDLSSGTSRFLGQATRSASDPALSADGRYLAHLSVALEGLGIFQSQPAASVWWRDLQAGTAVVVHPASFADAALATVAISPDGQLVAFVDKGTLSPGNPYANLYIRDIRTGTVTLISARPPTPGAAELPGDGNCTAPKFSPDGRWLFFFSTARNLTPEPSPFTHGLFARDLATRQTLLISSTPTPRYDLAISADSRQIASINSSGIDRIVIRDLETQTTTPVSNTIAPRMISLSATGRWLAYEDGAPGLSWRNIYVRDLVSQATDLITPRLGSTNQPTVGPANSPAISPDGRYVTFASLAPDLVNGDSNNVSDIFIRDRWRGTTVLASANRTGSGSANGPSILPVLSADGRTLLFHSAASDLIDGDDNDRDDVFILRLSGADADGDGLDDDWEMTYFSTLDRNGNGDWDADGSTDAIEHQLGTDPTNISSVFRVLRLSREDGGPTKLLWSAAPGRSYRVQYRDDAADGDWMESPEPVTAAGTTAVWTDATASTAERRFYRVLLIP